MRSYYNRIAYGGNWSTFSGDSEKTGLIYTEVLPG